jgi:hypothetical protein
LGIQILLCSLLIAAVPDCIGNACRLGLTVDFQGAPLGYLLVAVVPVGLGTTALVALLPNLEALMPADHSD